MNIDPHGPTVDWAALETAFEHNAPETHSYLDLETGAVTTIVDSRPEDDEKRRQIRSSPAKFLHLEPASSREQYRWMERFVASVEDETLKERLVLAIDGKGAFRRFKDVLLSYPVERDRWFAYRATLLHIYINGWLNTQPIKIKELPPWGEPTQPDEPDVPLDKPVGDRGEGPSPSRSRNSPLGESPPSPTSRMCPSTSPWVIAAKDPPRHCVARPETWSKACPHSSCRGPSATSSS